VAAYDERLAAVEGDATRRRLLGLAVAGVSTAAAAAKLLRRQKQSAVVAAAAAAAAAAKTTFDTEYFRRQKVVVGLSALLSICFRCYY